jgi:hypothetical protein
MRYAGIVSPHDLARLTLEDLLVLLAGLRAYRSPAIASARADWQTSILQNTDCPSQIRSRRKH